VTAHVRGEVIEQRAPVIPAEPAFVELQVAPFRRAFLVRRGDRDQLLAATLGAATIWGGTRCPILPVEPDGTVGGEWLKVAEAADPAVIVDFTVSGEGGTAWTGACASRWPVVPARPLSDHAFWNPHPIAAIQPDELENLTLYLPKGRTLLDAASAGCVELPEEASWWRQVAYAVLDVDGPRQLASAQLGEHTVLSAAVLNDDDSTADVGWDSMMLLWLTSDPDDPDEITRWWNTRALRSRRWYRSISILATPDAAQDERFADDLRNIVRRHVRTHPDLVLSSDSVPDSQLHAIAGQLGFENKPSGAVRQPLAPAGPPDPGRQLAYMISHDLLDRWGASYAGGAVSVTAISVQRPVTRIRQASPLPWNPGMYGTGRVSLRVSGPPFAGPRLPQVARLYHERARWHRDSLELPDTVRPVYDFQVSVPGPDEILRAACSARNVTYALSDKARHVHGVWALARDPGMFRRPEVIDVIRALTAESSRELIKQLQRSELTTSEKQEIRVLAAANRVTIRTLKEIASLPSLSGRARPSVAAALQLLVTAGMVVRGLRADCPVCLVRHLYALDEARPVPTCPGCGAEAVYAAGDGTGEPALYYRVNTLVQTLSVNGGLAPLAATALLATEGAYVVPGAQLFLDGADAGEVDLLGWRDEIVFAGEAKMSAAQLAASDHDKDVSKSVLAGADEHLAICLETIPPQTCGAIQAACDRAGIALVVLDAAELLTA
jgi:hypothetical protein